MKLWMYVVPSGLVVLGIWVGTLSGLHNEDVTLFGLTVPGQVARGIGLILALAASVLGFALYGSTLPPNEAEQRIERDRQLWRERKPAERERVVRHSQAASETM
ncbi:MAG: hypothetical protein AB7G75_06945 [Candidatus Binatia bacterium]